MVGDSDLLALCCFEEANLEPDDGLAAVARVIKNRMALHYQSDGTVSGTILHGNGTAFSWVGFAMVDGHYQRVASGPDQIAARVAQLSTVAHAYGAKWSRACEISAAVMDGTYEGGEPYQALTDDAVLYLNPAISHTAWATPENLVCAIGHHNFYRDG